MRWTARGVSALLLLSPSCTGAGGAALPKGPAVVDVVLDEYSFAVEGEMARGRVVVRADNAGGEDHEILVVFLPKGVPPIREQLAGDERRTVASMAQTARLPAGAEGGFAVDLGPGRYAFLCFIEAPDGTPHALKGMAWEFRVD